MYNNIVLFFVYNVYIAVLGKYIYQITNNISQRHYALGHGILTR